MDVATRVRICRLLEQMHDQAEYSKKLGLEDKTQYAFLIKNKEKENEQNSIKLNGGKSHELF